DVFRAYGRKQAGGILLYGPPGCGKTLLARATAGECGASFLNVATDAVLGGGGVRRVVPERRHRRRARHVVRREQEEAGPAVRAGAAARARDRVLRRDRGDRREPPAAAPR